MRRIFTCLLLVLASISVLSMQSCRKKPPVQPQVREVEISPASLLIAGGDTKSYPLSAKIKNAGTETAIVSWRIANPDIASVDNNGLVKGLRIGTTSITATLNDGTGSGVGKIVVYDTNDYKYRLVLKDKGPVSYSLSRPQEFLSAKALDKRTRLSIPLDSADMPISRQYLQQIESTGAKIVAQSKWLNTVSIHCYDPAALEKCKALPFVKSSEIVWQGKKDTTAYFKTLVAVSPNTVSRSVNAPAYYGAAWDNISLNNGHYLHDNGFKGKGIEIAVMDVGFKNIAGNPSLSNINIRGAKSFIYEAPDPYAAGNHGIYVTSIMACNKPEYFVGTAPEAGYWLFMTEDENSEYPIEEDYWVAALEYADSVGADVVNTSLSYKEYIIGTPPYPYKFEDMNGRTTQAARGANAGTAKGMLIVCSAGNDRSWVGTPADSPEALTVGAMDKLTNISTFSSYGMTVDGRMKPDVVALGTSASVINLNGTAVQGNGTSFSGPIMAGLAACLWQAYPKLNNREVISVIKQSANRYAAPVLPFGNGIPDMQKAMVLAKALSDKK